MLSRDDACTAADSGRDAARVADGGGMHVDGRPRASPWSTATVGLRPVSRRWAARHPVLLAFATSSGTPMAGANMRATAASPDAGERRRSSRAVGSGGSRLPTARDRGGCSRVPSGRGQESARVPCREATAGASSGCSASRSSPSARRRRQARRPPYHDGPPCRAERGPDHVASVGFGLDGAGAFAILAGQAKKPLESLLRPLQRKHGAIL